MSSSTDDIIPIENPFVDENGAPLWLIVWNTIFSFLDETRQLLLVCKAFNKLDELRERFLRIGMQLSMKSVKVHFYEETSMGPLTILGKYKSRQNSQSFSQSIFGIVWCNGKTPVFWTKKMPLWFFANHHQINDATTSGPFPELKVPKIMPYEHFLSTNVPGDPEYHHTQPRKFVMTPLNNNLPTRWFKHRAYCLLVMASSLNLYKDHELVKADAKLKNRNWTYLVYVLQPNSRYKINTKDGKKEGIPFLTNRFL